MRVLSGGDGLDIWERGLHMHPVDRALLALCMAHPDIPADLISAWPLGKRNRALAELHCRSFGAQLEGVVDCPHCNEPLEFSMDGRGLAIDEPSLNEPIVIREHAFRVPTSRDLAAAAGAADTQTAMARLLESCRLDEAGPSLASDDLTADEMEQVGERMAAADPMAEVRIRLHCFACGHEWEETLDWVEFLWSELEADAQRVLYEVHTLACAYGWAEAEILSLSERRRAAYVEMVRV